MINIKTEIFLSVDDSKAKAATHGFLTAGAVGVQVHIDITGERWENLAPVLVASCNDVSRKVVINDGESVVPPECLIEGGHLYLGVDGKDLDLTIRIPTLLAYCGEVQKSTDSISPDDMVDPTPELVDQILYIANSANEKASEVLRMASSGELNGDTYELTDSDIDEIAESARTKVIELVNEDLNEKIESPTVANIGQMLVVKSVDQNGRPSEWECIDNNANIVGLWHTVAEVVIDTVTQTYWLPNLNIGNCRELIISFTTVSNAISSIVFCDTEMNDAMSFINALESGIRYGKIFLKIIDGNLFVENYISGNSSNALTPGQTGRNHFAKITYGSNNFGKLNIHFSSLNTILLPGTKFTFYGR